MDENEHTVMAVSKNSLLGQDYYFEGFAPADRFDFEKRILDNIEWIPRNQAEQDPSYKQPIAYCIILNPTTKKIFLYRRAEKHTDQRLKNKYSIGIGGHIHKTDAEVQNPIYASLLREIKEETKTEEELKNLKVLGYLNQDNGQIEQYHFGVLYTIETDSDIFPAGNEIAHGEMKNIEEIYSLAQDENSELENWSKIALEQIKKIFGED